MYKSTIYFIVFTRAIVLNISSTEHQSADYSGSSDEQNNRLLHLEKNILEAVALNKDPQAILDDLCHAAESIVENSIASIMLFDDSRESLQVRSAPNIPETIVDQLNGLVPGNYSGSCGSAVYQCEPVYVENTLVDERWNELKPFAIEHGINACWSHPIKTRDNLVIGSFAISSFKTRPASEFQQRLLSIAANISGIVIQREKQEQELWNLAHRDLVTGIPNRIFLNQRLEHAIGSAARKNTRLALFFIDLDKFKNINDTYGHKTGDQVLIETAKRINACIRSDDTLSRYGGDEFVLLVENLSESADVGQIAEKILSALAEPIFINNAKLKATPSIGISLYPDDGSEAEALLNHADTAMYEAKSNGRNTYMCYEPSLTQAIQHRHKVESELKRALNNNELILHYQPQCFKNHQQSVSVEALVRWQHPELGLVYPDYFIQIAEQSGLIKQLGEWVIGMACKQGKQWLDDGITLNKIAINISAMQITRGCYAVIKQALDESGLPSQHLEIEITESSMVQQSSDVIKELQLMQNAGISIALDDFGTGYSSLSQLQLLPINKLKIDRSFVAQIPGKQSNEIITRTIIAMGRSLGLSVLAEGVETEDQVDFLLQEGCDAFQGYLYSKPLSVSDLEQQVQSKTLLKH